MHNHNQELRDIIGIGSFLDGFLPEIYEAITIDDFIQNAEQIEGTSLWKAPFLLPSLFLGRALVNFIDVNVKYKGDDYLISDLNGELYVKAPPFSFFGFNVSRESIEEGKYHNVMINYHPKSKTSSMFFTYKLGPGAENKKPFLDLFQQPKLCPIYIKQ